MGCGLESAEVLILWIGLGRGAFAAPLSRSVALWAKVSVGGLAVVGIWPGRRAVLCVLYTQ